MIQYAFDPNCSKEEEQKEVERVSKDERKVWGEALRFNILFGYIRLPSLSGL